MRGPDEWDDRGRPGGSGERPRIPGPRPAAEDHGPLPDLPSAARVRTDPPGTVPDPAPPHHVPAEYESDDAPVTGDATGPRHPAPAAPSHKVLKSLLGAWALSACSPEETAAVEEHLTDCATCADEALRLRDAVGLLHPADSLDLDPLLRSRVLEGCLGRRPARIPVPDWVTPYDAETAKLDALLRDMGEAEWRAPVRLRWFDGREPVEHPTTVAGVIGHLMAVDGMVATALGLPDPLGAAAPEHPGPRRRTEAYWQAVGEDADPHAPHDPWREQGQALIRTASFAGGGVAELSVPYGKFSLSLRDAFLDRAFETWVHAGDIAEAVDYPYRPPAAGHLHRLVDLAARLLPSTLAQRRQAGLAAPAHGLVAAGAPGRSLHLEVEGSGGGDWYIALDSPAAVGSPEYTVAHIALDSDEFCQLAAGHISPEEAAAGQTGEREAIREVLFATAALSRL
ncbi:zf-HC2 domain-containing protein [Streptomyces sp. VTCC 41912]|uniref:zf-HC2 domain-containing protein n=1 Tax=Streptomyces TaxID=1883 RepID=UPI001F30DC77|nr:zf-HC2 domain-containing protein [Streptomyces noursei]MCE4947455.1 zf-HC2 domain-containing protein [Streptomyces noursei]